MISTFIYTLKVAIVMSFPKLLMYVALYSMHHRFYHYVPANATVEAKLLAMFGNREAMLFLGSEHAQVDSSLLAEIMFLKLHKLLIRSFRIRPIALS